MRSACVAYLSHGLLCGVQVDVTMSLVLWHVGIVVYVGDFWVDPYVGYLQRLAHGLYNAHTVGGPRTEHGSYTLLDSIAHYWTRMLFRTR